MLSNISGNYTVSFVEKYLAENAKGKWQWIRDAFAKLDDESKSNVIKHWMVQHGVRTRS